MPVVKRFSTLGQRRKIDPTEVSSAVLPVESKIVNRLHRDQRKVRNDRKHQYPLRSPILLWKSVKELNLNCCGPENGPSLNDTLCKLLSLALADKDLVTTILNDYPDRVDLIKIRTWGRD